jgi:hypothetical protein
MKSCNTTTTGFPDGPVPPVADPQAGASVEFFETPGDPSTLLVATLPASPDPLIFAPTVPISSFAGAANPGLQAGPDNSLFTYLGSGRLLYTGPVGLFLIQGGVTVETSDAAGLDIVINGVPLIRTGTATIGGGTTVLVAGAVRKLKSGDVVELGMFNLGVAPNLVAIVSLEMTVIAVGRP